jgi:hypothetical protein
MFLRWPLSGLQNSSRIDYTLAGKVTATMPDYIEETLPDVPGPR